MRKHVFGWLLLALIASIQLSAQETQKVKDDLSILDDLPLDELEDPEAPKPKTPSAPPVTAAKVAEPAPPSPKIEDLPIVPDDPIEPEVAKNDDILEISDAPEEVNAPQAAAPLAAEPPVIYDSGTPASSKVTAIEFKQLNDRVRLIIKGDKELFYARDPRPQKQQLLLELKDTELSRAHLKRPLDTAEFDGPIALIQPFEARTGSSKSVKILIQMRNYTEATISRTGNSLIVDYPLVSGNQLFKTASTRGEVILPETFISPRDKMTFTGARISLNVKDAELADVIRFISSASGRNFVLAEGATGKVTMSVQDTPWDQILTIVLLNNGMGYQKLGNIYRIAAIQKIKEELSAAVTAEQERQKLMPQETRIYRFSYAKASEIKSQTESLLTKPTAGGLAGSSTVDNRTNALIATDTTAVHQQLDSYIRAVDLQTAQVLIEGRVVTAKKGFSRTFLTQWKVNGGPYLSMGGEPSNATNGVSFRFPLAEVISVGNFSSVLASLSAVESQQKVRTIASPRLVVRDNVQGTIDFTGTRYRTILTQIGEAASVPQTVTLNLTTKLAVKPNVSADGFIGLEVSLQRDTPAPSSDDDQGGKDSQSITSDLLVENGKTAVIGGIYTSEETKSRGGGLPYLMDIPILGALFTNDWKRNDDLQELIMFLSPKVINEDRAQIAIKQGTRESLPKFNGPSQGTDSLSL